MPVTRIKCRWVNGMQEFFDYTTGENCGTNAPVTLYDDFLGPAIDNVNDWNVSVEGLGTATINAAVGGHMRLTTAVGDNDEVEVASGLVFESSKGCACEARIAQADVPGTSFNFGFNDAINEAANTLALDYSGTTLTANSNNCAIWFQDPDATTNQYRCASVIATTAGTVGEVPLATATPTNAAFHTYRVELNENGDASFYFDGAFIKKELLGITTTTDLCVYCAVINREGFANTMDVDYIKAWQLR